jgi:hypothetical protein
MSYRKSSSVSPGTPKEMDVFPEKTRKPDQLWMFQKLHAYESLEKEC